MRRPGFEPGFWAWKAQVIATRPSTRTATHLVALFIYIAFAHYIVSREYTPNFGLNSPKIQEYLRLAPKAQLRCLFSPLSQELKCKRPSI